MKLWGYMGGSRIVDQWDIADMASGWTNVDALPTARTPLIVVVSILQVLV